MFIREITSLVIAALLLTGGVATASQVTEYGVQPVKEQNITLTQEEAKAIALNHAGLTEEDISGLQVETDVEKGIQKWDVDFHSGEWEYDYEINAETGNVIRGEKEYDPVKTQKTEKPAQTEPAPTKPAQEEIISEDEAKEIALEHAGLKASQVKGLWAKYDVDDGVPEWEVEFYADGMEYDYEIHGKTGKIRSWDKDRED